jgi:ABC-type multidrug transport system ATPase subunit
VGKKANPAHATDLLAKLGLADHANKPVPTLSGGLRQRLALAIALLADPPVLLLDEPTANLDAQAQREYLALLSMLCHEEGKTLVFASHRLEEVEMLAKRVLVLEHGRLVKVLTPAELLNEADALHPAHLVGSGGASLSRVDALRERWIERALEWPRHRRGAGAHRGQDETAARAGRVRHSSH